MDNLTLIVIISVLGPIIGSAIGVMRKASLLYICNMLCFAAGVMLTISFMELIPESIKMGGVWFCVTGIGVGTMAMFALDRLIPHIHPELCSQEQGCQVSLEKTSIYLIAGIFMHNFPEGMAIGIGGMAGEKVSLTIALAIAIHNIPEGVCTSSPYYLTTGKRLKAFLVSSSTAIPIVAGYIFARYLFPGMNEATLGIITGATAGLMIYIAADELIPASCQVGQSHSTIFSLMAGVLFVIILGIL